MTDKCPNCSKPIKDGYLFCGKCGYKLPQVITQKEEKTPKKEIDEEMKEKVETKKEKIKDKEIETKKFEAKEPIKKDKQKNCR